MTIPFAHLHVHSHYSPLDGITLVDKLLAKAKDLGQTAMAITDHGVMYGAIDFYTTAKYKEMKPLIGFEAYVAPGDRKEKGGYNHITLLARNLAGYQNLSRLCTEGFLTGFYHYPRIDKTIMREMAEGVTCLSGCLRGEIPQLILAGKIDEAEAAARNYRDMFGENNFYLEVMDNGLADQKGILGPMREISKRTGIPLVATSDVHYLEQADVAIQDIMICINTGKFLSDEKRMHAGANGHLKSVDEMLACMPGCEDAIENTMKIVEQCNLEMPLKGFHLPTLKIPDGLTAAEYLEKTCREGLKKRYADPLPQAVEERFQKELSVIVTMGFPDYFLIVWDVVKFARDNGIPVGPGRGSAAGSIIAYGLGITNLDPLKYNLFFERFLNEGRNEMPDIDLDFDKERRQEVVSHIIDTHGSDHCAKIVTFGCLSLKSGIRDVARVMSIPLARADKLAKMIPDMFKAEKGSTPFQTALKTIPELKDEYDADPEVKKWLDAVDALEGVMRNTGVHAAGVLVADKNITDYGPLAARGGEVTTQYEMKALEKLGLCKIDVLGLETLSLIKNAVDIIKINTGVDVDIDHLPLDDKPTYDMLSRGDAKGVFQFESEGFRQLLAKLKPDVFEDLIAAVAIYRPGPLQFLPNFINRKHGREPLTYLHPLMEPILNETYGLILYQEQVQALAQNLAHFTLSEGDLMRRAMGKKDAKIMAEYRQKFITQATPTIGENIATQAYDQIEVFAGYGFNKSHSACYALIAYQTAYLKCHYPKEYLAALLTISRSDASDIVTYMADANSMGIEVLPVDINASDAFFAVQGNSIRYGLSAVKGVGENAATAVENERKANGPFRDLFDFTERVDLKAINKGAMEALIKAGAMDSFGNHRAALTAGLESAIANGNAEQKAKASGQMGLFANFAAEAPRPQLPKVPEWTEPQKLQFEKSVLGFYSTSHPLASHSALLKTFATAGVSELIDMDDRANVILGGLISRISLKNDKNGNRYAHVDLEDMDGQVGGVVFASVYEKYKELLVEDAVVFVQAELDRTRDQPSLRINSIVPLDKASETLAVRAVLKLPMTDLDQEKLVSLRTLAGQNPGNARLYFNLESPEGSTIVRAADRFTLNPNKDVVAQINSMFGEGVLSLGGRRLG